ncbi:hypothetical protein MWH28_11660 [Natroniella sulfidigena]|uniref:hypothetical protein n=1 Tax=Natroniella sulfidigena TaxID=723921 RepID=UPI00200A19D7|nr:hypothetical protein [Natroniella sulfidigena]MCK8818013.1 hypothetical protein [Natroniella sulfidigena]
MKIKKVFILVSLILLLSSSNLLASTLNLGENVYRVQVLRFQSGEGDFITVDLGYGVNNYSGYGLSFTAPYGGDTDGSGVASIEYQFVPENIREAEQNFNWALKVGATSGNILEEDDEASSGGLKFGLIMEREFDKDAEVYFDLDVTSDLVGISDFIVNAELGIGKELAEGIKGVVAARMLGGEDLDSNHGTTYGLKVEF